MKPYVLVVDDDEDTRLLMTVGLAGCGAEIRTASTGREALEILRSGDTPALMLLDLSLPDLGGEDIVVLAQEEELLEGQRIIVASGWEGVETRLLQLGVRRVLLKPLVLAQIQAYVRESLLALRGPETHAEL